MRRRNSDLVRLTTTAVMMAVTILFARLPGLSFYVPVGGVNLIKLSFDAIPSMICALLCGPFYGGLCAGGADLIGALAFPTGGAYYPGFTINAIVFGVLPPLILKAVKNHSVSELITGACLIAFAFIGLYATLPFVNTLKIGDWKMTITPLWVALIPLIFMFAALAILFLTFFLARREKKHFFSFFDVYIAFLIRNLIVSAFLTPIWLNQLYGAHFPYSFGFLMTFISRAIELPVEATLTYIVLLPTSKVAASLLEDTYGSDEKVSLKLRGKKRI